ncbi:MAG: MarC family protein [Acidobacteriota bacterium]
MHARLLPLIIRLVDFFTIAFSALFPLLNPLGSAMLFLGLVGPADAIVYRRLARRVALYTVLFLMVVDLAGAVVLTFFGISLPVIQVAGGLVLASMGWKLLSQPDAPEAAQGSAASRSLEDLDSEAFYPFTFPLTAGPGAVVVTLTLAAHAEQSTAIDSVFSQIGLFLAILVLCGMVYFSYGYAPALARKVSRQTIHGVLRIISFILLAIGVQIFWRGAEVLLREALRIHS